MALRRNGQMRPASKVGKAKSWLYVVALTFVVPAGAGQLTNLLFVSLTQAGEEAPAAYSHKIVVNHQTAQDCPESELNRIL